MYAVESPWPVPDQVAALPASTLVHYAEVRIVLETAPWSGAPYHAQLPDGPMRTLPFGSHGLLVYLILEHQRRVAIVRVHWGGS